MSISPSVASQSKVSPWGLSCFVSLKQGVGQPDNLILNEYMLIIPFNLKKTFYSGGNHLWQECESLGK